MQNITSFFSGFSFVPYVSFVVRRENFIRWKVSQRTIEDHELVLITEGDGLLKTPEEKFPCPKGTLLYLHENLWHSIEATKTAPITFYSVHFSYSRSLHSSESWEYNEDINYFLKSDSPDEKVWSFNTEYEKLPFPNTLTIRQYNTVEDIFIKMNRIYRTQSLGYELQINSLLLELIHIIFKEVVTPMESDENKKKLDMAREYIDEHYAESITLHQLTNRLNVSESFLIKLFKNNTGMTPISYINQVRVNRGKNMLLNTQLSIKEVAYYLGFCDEYYFSRTFKKVTGLSPSVFRNRI